MTKLEEYEELLTAHRIALKHERPLIATLRRAKQRRLEKLHELRAELGLPNSARIPK